MLGKLIKYIVRKNRKKQKELRKEIEERKERGEDTRLQEVKLRLKRANYSMLQILRRVVELVEGLLLAVLSLLGFVWSIVLAGVLILIIILMTVIPNLGEEGQKDKDKGNGTDNIVGELQWTDEELSRYKGYYNGYEQNLFKLVIMTKAGMEGYGKTDKYKTIKGSDIGDTVLPMYLGIQTIEGGGFTLYVEPQGKVEKDVYVDPSTYDSPSNPIGLSSIVGPYQLGQYARLDNTGHSSGSIPTEVIAEIKAKYKNEKKGLNTTYYPYASMVSIAHQVGKIQEQRLGNAEMLGKIEEIAKSYGIKANIPKMQSEMVGMMMQTAYHGVRYVNLEDYYSFLCAVWAYSSDVDAERGFHHYSFRTSGGGLDLSSMSGHASIMGGGTSAIYKAGGVGKVSGNVLLHKDGVKLRLPLWAELNEKYKENPYFARAAKKAYTHSENGAIVINFHYGLVSYLEGKQIMEYLRGKLPASTGGEGNGEGFKEGKLGEIQGPWNDRKMIEYLEKSKNKKYYGSAYAVENKDKKMSGGMTYEDWRKGSKWGVPYYRQSSRVVESKVGYGSMKLGLNGCHVFMNAYIASGLTGTLINPTEMMDAMVYSRSLQPNGYYNNTYTDVNNVMGYLGIYMMRGDMRKGSVGGEDRVEIEKVVGKFSSKIGKAEWKDKVDKLLERDGMVGLSMGNGKTDKGYKFTSDVNHYIVLTEKVGGGYKTMSYGTGRGGMERDTQIYTWDEIYRIASGGGYGGQIYFAYNPNIGRKGVGEKGRENFSGVSEEEKNELLFGTKKRPRTAVDISATEIGKKIETVEVQVWVKEWGRKKSKTVKISVHRELKSSIKRIMQEIYEDSSKPIMNYGGGFCYRTMNNGTGTKNLSNHSFGAAFDFNVPENPYVKGGEAIVGSLKKYRPGKDERSFSKEHIVVRTFEKYGWRWGGEYGDYMHFELLQ